MRGSERTRLCLDRSPHDAPRGELAPAAAPEGFPDLFDRAMPFAVDRLGRHIALAALARRLPRPRRAAVPGGLDDDENLEITDLADETGANPQF